MATTTNWGWTTPDDTALVANGANAIRSLGTAIDTSLGTRVGVTVTRTGTQSVAASTDTAISWTATTYNSPTFITPTATLLTVPASSGGIYAITVSVAYATDPGSSSCWLDITRGGTRWATFEEAGSSSRWNPVAGRFLHGVCAIMVLAVGDTVTCYTRQATAGAINITAIADCYRIWK